jgi:hypothetical protein
LPSGAISNDQGATAGLGGAAKIADHTNGRLPWNRRARLLSRSKVRLWPLKDLATAETRLRQACAISEQGFGWLFRGDDAFRGESAVALRRASRAFAVAWIRCAITTNR